MRLLPSYSRIGFGALVLAALAVGQALDRYLPSPDPGRPFVTEVSADGIHHLRFGDLEVLEITGSRTVDGSAHGDPVTESDGVFLVVTFAWTALENEAGFTVPTIRSGVLHDDAGGVTTFSSSGSRSTINCNAAPLTLPARCTAVVEAVPERLPGATLVLGSDALDERYDSVAGIDLDVTADEVARWEDADPVVLPPTGPELNG